MALRLRCYPLGLVMALGLGVDGIAAYFTGFGLVLTTAISGCVAMMAWPFLPKPKALAWARTERIRTARLKLRGAYTDLMALMPATPVNHSFSKPYLGGYKEAASKPKLRKDAGPTTQYRYAVEKIADQLPVWDRFLNDHPDHLERLEDLIDLTLPRTMALLDGYQKAATAKGPKDQLALDQVLATINTLPDWFEQQSKTLLCEDTQTLLVASKTLRHLTSGLPV